MSSFDQTATHDSQRHKRGPSESDRLPQRRCQFAKQSEFWRHLKVAALELDDEGLAVLGVQLHAQNDFAAVHLGAEDLPPHITLGL